MRVMPMPVITFQEARRRLSVGELPEVLVLQGEERFLAGELVRLLRERLSSGDEMVDCVEWDESASEEEIMTMLTSLPFGAQKRLAVLNNPGPALLTSCLKVVNPCLYLAVISNARLKTGISQAAEKRGWVVDCLPLRGAELKAWLQDEARSRRKELPLSAVEFLRLMCGENPAQMRQEIEKASLYLGENSRVITVQVLKQVGSRTAARNVFELVDAVAGRNEHGVRQAMEDLLDRGEPPVRLVALLARHFLMMLELVCLLEEGVLPQKLPEVMGIQPFVARKLLQQSGGFSKGALEGVLYRLLELDRSLKQGRGNPQLLLEAAMFEIINQKPLTRMSKRH